MIQSKAPIKSSYDLIQEHYWPDAWKMMVCCMLLNMTTRKQVDGVVDHFFTKYNSPEEASKANVDEMIEIIKELGLVNRRSISVIKMSQEWITNEWNKVIELHGLGQYAQDCYDMFINRYHLENPSDRAIKNYNKWLGEHI